MALILTVNSGDQILELDTDSITPLETRLIKRHTGMKLSHVLQGLAPGEVDGDAVAAIVWLAQRRVNPYLPYPDNTPVSELLGMIDVKLDLPEPDGDEDGTDGPKEPEATGAGSKKPGAKSSKSAPKVTSTT